MEKKNVYFPCRTAELGKEAMYCKLCSVNRASWAGGNEYLTGCSEVSQKIFRLEIKRNRFYTRLLLFTVYLLLGKPIKGYDGDYPIYITGML